MAKRSKAVNGLKYGNITKTGDLGDQTMAIMGVTLHRMAKGAHLVAARAERLGVKLNALFEFIAASAFALGSYVGEMAEKVEEESGAAVANEVRWWALSALVKGMGVEIARPGWAPPERRQVEREELADAVAMFNGIPAANEPEEVPEDYEPPGIGRVTLAEDVPPGEG